MTAGFTLTSREPDASVTKQIINRDAHMDHRMHRQTEFVTPSRAVGTLMTTEDKG
jgi:hypothetical protein